MAPDDLVVPHEAQVADDAIGRFLANRRAGLDVRAARQQATVDAAFEYASAWPAAERPGPEPTDRQAAPAEAAHATGSAPQTVTDGVDDDVIVIDPRGIMPAVPAIRGFNIADDAISRFLDHQQAGLEVSAAREQVITAHREAHKEQAPSAPPDLDRTVDNGAAELELAQALADAPEDVRDAYWRSRDLARDGPDPGRATDTGMYGPARLTDTPHRGHADVTGTEPVLDRSACVGDLTMEDADPELDM